jgi:hypothetical protein
MMRDWMTMGTTTYACPSGSTVSVAFFDTDVLGGKDVFVKWGESGRPASLLSTQMLAETV